MNDNTRAVVSDLDADITVHNHGSVWTFTPNNLSVKHWLDEHVQIADWQRIGESFAADHRPAAALADALESAGFFVHFQQTPKGQR